MRRKNLSDITLIITEMYENSETKIHNEFSMKLICFVKYVPKKINTLQVTVEHC